TFCIGFVLLFLVPSTTGSSTLSLHDALPILTGSVTIANVSPLCSITGSAPATGPDLVITSSNGRIQVVALNWTLENRCELISPFQVTLSSGTYSLNLSSCSYMGCRVLPIIVVVVPGVFTPVRINIVTGIY